MQWILLVEDDEAAAALLQARLADSPWRVERTATLEDAFTLLEETLADGPPTAVLLDLNLPDSAGFSTVSSVLAMAPQLPIVVITGIMDDALRLLVVESGAQEFVLKSDLEKLDLLIATAIARQRHRNHGLAMAVTAGMHLDDEKRPFTTSLDNHPLLQRSQTAPTPLSEALPEVFEQFTTTYSALVKASLEARAYKTQDRPVADIKQFARDLGVVNCAPRDIVDIHLHSIEMTAQAQHPERVVALADEGRVIVLELMGYLAMHYRDHAPFRFSFGSDT